MSPGQRLLPTVLGAAGALWLLAALAAGFGTHDVVAAFASGWAALMSWLAGAAVRASIRWRDWADAAEKRKLHAYRQMREAHRPVPPPRNPYQGDY